MTRRIVVLDGFTLTPNRGAADDVPGEPSWSELARLGELSVFDRTPASEVAERIGDAPIVLTNKAIVSRATIEASSNLKYVGVLATGTNVVDLAAANEHGVVVTNVPAYGPMSVAQHVFALILRFASRVSEHDAAVQDGQWEGGVDFCLRVAPTFELAGKTLGVVGPGDIGSRVAAIGHALGMNVLVHGRTERDLGTPVEWTSLETLLASSDIISLHCPLTESTRHLINEDRLATMKPGAMLINTGRGPLIDEAAVASALKSGRLGFAGLDVLSKEPPADGSPLIGAPNCVITPHMAWATVEARHRLMKIATDNVKAFLDGRPHNVVSG